MMASALKLSAHSALPLLNSDGRTRFFLSGSRQNCFGQFSTRSRHCRAVHRTRRKERFLVLACAADVESGRLQIEIDGLRKLRIGVIKKELDALGVAYGDCFEKEELVRRLATVQLSNGTNSETAPAEKLVDEALVRMPMRKLKSTMTSPKEYILIQVIIGNKGPFDFLLDTGSSTTVVSPSVAHGKLGISPGEGKISRGLGGMGDGGVDTREVLLPPFIIGGHRCKPVTAVIIDLANTGLSSSIAGILGLNVLSQFDVEFDFPKEQIAFYEGGAAIRGDCDMHGMGRLAISSSTYALPGLQVDLGGANRQMAIVDLGSSLSVTSPRVAKSAGATMEIGAAGFAGIGVGGQRLPFSNAFIDVTMVADQEKKNVVFKRVQFAIGELPAMSLVNCNVILGTAPFGVLQVMNELEQLKMGGH